ncbi:MAG: PAS domain S-box-containing protein, partial [Kiritimatiellia bacterium]
MQVYLGVLICAGFALAASNNSHADAQASVLASEDRLRALISAVPDVLMVYDQHGNPVERLSGITSTDTNVSLTASNQQSFYTIVKQIIATGETQEIEYPVRSGPEETWWWARAVRVYNEQQPHVLWVARDITQQKQLESGLRQK